ncbi:MAG: hypothetical protein RL127_1689 [Bacteroidota bacterium]
MLGFFYLINARSLHPGHFTSNSYLLLLTSYFLPLTSYFLILTSYFLPLPYCAPAIIESTTLGSNRVDVSPKLPNSPSATLRKIRRIIFPERVLGKPVTN